MSQGTTGEPARPATEGPGGPGSAAPASLTLGGVALGTRPWLVLGGGGLRGLAHLGVWKALKEVDFRPAGILGTSIGALVGACIAAGRPVGEMEAEARAMNADGVSRLRRRALWIQGIRASSLYRGEPLREVFARSLPADGWEALRTPFQTNAVELGSGRTEWFGTGARTDVSLLDAVIASAALPVFYPPVPLPGGIYVDGGVEDALPLGRAEALGATGIVAVDVGAGEEADGEEVLAGGMLAVHDRVFSLMVGRRRRETVAGWTGVPLLYIRPDFSVAGGFDFERIGEVIELGWSTAKRTLG